MDLTPYKECRAHKNAIFIGNEEPIDSTEPAAGYRPCCWFKDSITASSFKEYQEKLAKVDIEKNCKYCIDMENQGGAWSHRKQFDSYDIDEITVSISFDNLCNLKCITCSPSNSSQLALEVKNPTERKKYIKIQKLGKDKTYFLKEMLSSLSINKLRLEILGGEPLINPVVYDFLDWLILQPYAKETSVTLTTNGTTFDDRLITYINQIANFKIQMSIDGINEVFEYIRFGAKFSEFKKNADKFYKLTYKYPNKVFLSFNYTLSWMNCVHISDFFKWIETNYPNIEFILVTKLEYPKFYAISVLPNETRNKIVEQVTKEVNTELKALSAGLNFFTQHMSITPYTTEHYLLDRGKFILNKNDSLPNRNSNYKETFRDILALL